MKDYKLWHGDVMKYITSRDVTFKEDEMYMSGASKETNYSHQESGHGSVSL